METKSAWEIMYIAPELCLDNGFGDTKLVAAGGSGQHKDFIGYTGLVLAAAMTQEVLGWTLTLVMSKGE